jgi:hypothetical protein
MDVSAQIARYTKQASSRWFAGTEPFKSRLNVDTYIVENVTDIIRTGLSIMTKENKLWKTTSWVIEGINPLTIRICLADIGKHLFNGWQ